MRPKKDPPGWAELIKQKAGGSKTLPIIFCISLAALHGLTLAQPRVQLGGIDAYL